MHPADALAERLGLPVHDRDLLAQALIHSSWLHEHPDAAPGHNERLEFLGDAVVSLAVSEALYRRHPADDEGVLSARRAAIVSTPGLARLADPARPRLVPAARRGRGAARRPRPAVPAGVGVRGPRRGDLPRPRLGRRARLDPRAGGGGAVRRPHDHDAQEPQEPAPGAHPADDRRAAASTGCVEAVGPDHEKQFRIEVVVDGRTLGVGEGPSRRIAETSAAAQALDVLRQERAASRAAKAASPGAADGAAAERRPTRRRRGFAGR